MANTILHKRSSTAGAIPPAGSLTVGELAINTVDGALFTKLSSGTVVNVVQQSGTWTPVIEQTSAAAITGIGYSLQSGNWVRTGDLVWAQGVIDLNAAPATWPTSVAWLAGLPYSFIGNGGGGVVYGSTSVTPAGAQLAIVAQGSANTQFRMRLRIKTTASTGFTDMSLSALSATTTLRFFTVYKTNDAP